MHVQHVTGSREALRRRAAASLVSIDTYSGAA
jgi:hypothetical protein